MPQDTQGGGAVHACVGGLCAEGDGHHQRVDVDMIQFALGFGLGGLKPGENLADRVVVELFGHARVNAA